MQSLAIALCFLLVTTRVLVVLGVNGEDISDERVPPGNELQDADQEARPIRYDEYPMIVPKRAALLLDRIMVALQKALEDEETHPSNVVGSERTPPSRNKQPPLLPLPRLSARDELESTQYLRMEPTNVGSLQRRGHTNNNNSNPKGRVWRCYFNAVTCFKKK